MRAKQRKERAKAGGVRTSAQPSTIAEVVLQPQARDEGPSGRLGTKRSKEGKQRERLELSSPWGELSSSLKRSLLDFDAGAGLFELGLDRVGLFLVHALL